MMGHGDGSLGLKRGHYWDNGNAYIVWKVLLVFYYIFVAGKAKNE